MVFSVVVAPPNKLKVISGPRGMKFIVGGCGIAFWCIDSVEELSLELMTIKIVSTAAETAKGVPLDVTSIAQVKVKAYQMEDKDGDGNADLDRHSITLAAQHFLGNSEAMISEAVRATLEGHQRQILGTLTVEEMYKDRAAFSEKVREHVGTDLGNMGFSVVSYTVTDISDEGGYMKSLGATQLALVKREAAEGTARNQSEAKKKVAVYESEAEIAAAEAKREAHVSVNTQAEAQAESDRDLNMKKAAFDKEVNRAQAEAQAATRIEQAKQNQTVVRETTLQEDQEAVIRLQIADREVERTKKEKEGNSLAELMQQRNAAESIRVLADAESDRIRKLGEANAAALRAQGDAEAAVMENKAAAYKQYGEAALVQMIVEQLPEIAEKLAAPLAKTEKMIFVGTDGTPSKLTGDVTNMMAQLPDAVEGLTGLDLRKALMKVAGQGAAK